VVVGERLADQVATPGLSDTIPVTAVPVTVGGTGAAGYDMDRDRQPSDG
jgi:hypothetical protein